MNLFLISETEKKLILVKVKIKSSKILNINFQDYECFIENEKIFLFQNHLLYKQIYQGQIFDINGQEFVFLKSCFHPQIIFKNIGTFKIIHFFYFLLVALEMMIYAFKKDLWKNVQILIIFLCVSLCGFLKIHNPLTDKPGYDFEYLDDIIALASVETVILKQTNSSEVKKIKEKFVTQYGQQHTNSLVNPIINKKLVKKSQPLKKEVHTNENLEKYVQMILKN